MGKRGKLLIWCVMVLLGVTTITMSGRTAESNGFSYIVLEDDTIEITGHTRSDTTVTILCISDDGKCKRKESSSKT